MTLPFDATLLKQNVPLEMREKKQWVRYVLTDPDEKGKRSKIPYFTTIDKKAASNKPDTWGTFEDAIGNVGKDGTYGIGYVFNSDYVGIDFDDCLPITGNEGKKIVERLLHFDTYTEKSVSGTGLHLICKGTIPKGINNRNLKTEMYMTTRFFAFTGDVVDSEATTIKECQPQIDELFNEIAPQNEEHDEYITEDNEKYLGYSLPIDIKIDAARQHLAGMEASVSGGNASGEPGHTSLLKACGVLVKGYALPYEEAYKLVCEYNKRAVPPWDDKDLHRKLSEGQKSTISLGAFLGSVFAEENRKERAQKFEDEVNKMKDRLDEQDALPKFVTLNEIVKNYKYIKNRYKTGFPTLDRNTSGGLIGGKVVVIVGSPGSGKTTWAIQMAENIANETPVFISAFLREEGRIKGSMRLLSFNGVDTEKFEMGDPTETAKALAIKGTIDFYIENAPGACFKDFINSVVKKKGDKQAIVIVDSLQVVSSLGKNAKDPRTDMLTLMNDAQQAAQTHNILLFLISQANRGSYAAPDPNMRTKGLAAASESSNIEYQADLLLRLVGDPKEPIKKVETLKSRFMREESDFWIKMNDRKTRLFTEIDEDTAIKEKKLKEVAKEQEQEKDETETISGLVEPLLNFMNNHTDYSWSDTKKKFKRGTTPQRQKAMEKALGDKLLESYKKKGESNKKYFRLTPKYFADAPVTMESLNLDEEK